MDTDTNGLELTVLGSGSSGNSIAVRAEGQVLLVDAGFSAIELQRRLEHVGIEPRSVIGILISHEHDDHVSAARVFAKRHGEPQAFANSLTTERLQSVGKAPARMCVFSNGSRFPIGPFVVEPFSVCHDAVDPVGFVIHWNGRKVGIATDMGHPGKMVRLKLRDVNILVLESNHEPTMLLNSSRPARVRHRIRGRRGHLSNDGAIELLLDVAGHETKHVVLTHLSDECNDVQLVRETVSSRLAAAKRDDINVVITAQDRPGVTLRV